MSTETVQLTYQPFWHQMNFLAHREKYRYRAAITGYGAGKTLTGVYEVLHWAFKYPGSVGWMGEPSFPMVNKDLIPALEHPALLNCTPFWNSPLVNNYLKSEHLIEWSNSSKTWFGHLSDPENVEGANFDYFYIDEARLVKRLGVAWRVLTSRLRGSGRSPKQGGWVTTTPDVRGSTLWNIFADPEERLRNAQYFQWSMLENPWLNREYLEDQNAMYKLPQDRQRFIHGRFGDVGLGTYSFDYKIHVIGRENPVRTILSKDDIKLVSYGIDWGFTAPFAMHTYLWDYDWNVQVVDEVYETRLKKSKIIELCHKKIKKWGEGKFWTGHEETEMVETMEEEGFEVEINGMSREDGIREVGGRFEDRSFNDRVGGIPPIVIDKRCKYFLQEIVAYDEKIKVNDHAADDCRYAVGNTVRERIPAFGTIRKPVSRSRQPKNIAERFDAKQPRPAVDRRRPKGR